MLMANTLNFRDPSKLVNIFDIKGSKVARTVKIREDTKPSTTLKDMNLLKI